MNCFSNISRKFLASKNDWFSKSFLTNALRKSIILFLLLFSFFSLAAEEGLGDFYLESRLLTWGFDMDFCLRLANGLLDNRDTIFRFNLGSSIDWLGYYRDENDHYTEDSDLDYMYTRTNANFGFAFEQGILWNEETNKNLLSFMFRYRSIRTWNFNMFDQDSLLFNSIRHDRDGGLYNTFIFSFLLDDTIFHKETGLRKGLSSEFSAEIGPKWFFNDVISIADFTRLFMNTKYFHPLYETKSRDKFIQAIYWADSIGIDYCFGENIPLPVRQTFGVLKMVDGCGGMVRGFERRRFDSEVKIINNFDLRFIMSQIKNKKSTKIFRPGFLVFFDTCYFDKLDGYKDNGSGVLMSTGFSLFSEFLFMGNCLLTVGFPIMGERIDGSPVSVSLNYGLRF